MLLLRHAAIAGAAIVLSLQSARASETPTTQDLVHATASGSYLAARHAGTERDSATAAAYYLNVLKADPRNADLLSRTFLSVLTDGDIDEAGRLADRVVQVDRNDRIARLVIGVRALKQKQYALARQNFAQSVRGPVTDLAATLLSAWALAGAGDTHTAIDTLDRLTGPDWYSIFKDLHAGLIFDVANNKKDAGKRYERAYKADAVALRTVEAYGRYLSRTGAKDDALKIYGEFEKTVPNHPVIMEEAKEVAAGEKLPPLGRFAAAGGAEALYGLGASIGRRGGEDLALIYLQLALYLEPTHQMALLSLADLYEALKKPDLAIKVYDRIPPSSPLHRNAEIQIASDLDTLDRTDEAKKRLEKLIAEHPKDNEAIMALANILRGRKQFAECGDVYSKAIANYPDARESQLGDLLFPRHLLRALQAMAEGRGRSEEGAGALSGSAAGAQLSRLFLDRPGHQSRRRHEHDPPRRRAAAGRRLHRRLARLGQFPHRQLRRGGQGSRARGRAQARRPDHQRSPRRRLLAGRPGPGGALPVVARQGPEARAGRPAEDRGQAQIRLPDDTSSAADAAKAKKVGNGG